MTKAIDPTGSTEPPLWTRFQYDGQTGFEDWETQGGYATLYRYGLGARGIDVMDRQAFYPSGPQQSVRCFPVYDAHGNCVATISRDGNGGFSLNDRRSFDAWGVVRSEQHGNDPRLRYCGSLGHKADDESGLVYMRARYYEPTSGRFVSEDPDKQASNWYVYTGNDPIDRLDSSGKGYVQECYALAVWMANFNTCTDENIEGRWADFISKFQRSDLNMLGGIAGIANADAKYVWAAIYGFMGDMSGATKSLATGMALSLVQGAKLGSEAAMICYAYQLRLSFYLKEIDE